MASTDEPRADRPYLRILGAIHDTHLTAFGVPGLVYALNQKATHDDDPAGGDREHKTWSLIIDDYLRGADVRMFYYLSAIPDPILRALIHGTLPSLMCEAEFASKYRDFLSL